MSLDLKIQGMLRSPAVQQINFTMRGIVVTGSGYGALANHFSDRYIRRRVRVVIAPGLVGRNSLAVYQANADVIQLRSRDVLSRPAGCGIVIHECTHALLDLLGLSASIRSEEGAAFVAQAWYYLAQGWNIETIQPRFPAAIAAIARELRAESLRSGGATVGVTADQINTLRRTMARFGYRNGHYVSNGVRGHIHRGERQGNGTRQAGPGAPGG